MGGLDAERYRDRERASGALRALGPDAALVLFGLDRSTWTLEKAARVDQIIASHSLLTREQAAQMATDADFLLDCMNSDEEPIRRVAAGYLSSGLTTPRGPRSTMCV